MTDPWLRPATASLLALTDDLPDARLLRDDPGLILHILRYSRPTPDPVTFEFDDATLAQPGLCETAAFLLEQPGEPAARNRAAEELGQRLARISSELARVTELCSPDAAWAAGLLAPLGRYLGAIDNGVSLGRRASARWRLPDWLQAAIGYLDLPIEETPALGAHRGLTRVLRAAIRASGTTLLPQLHEPDEDLDARGIALDADVPTFREIAREPAPELLPRLLRKTAQARGRTARSWIAPLEDRIDSLVGQLAEARLDFDHRLRDAKLAALAEFAAGASHEINNPLAVISGNAQWLRAREADPDKAQYLQTIVRQTRRIHDLLTGARQFACPSQVKTGSHSLAALLEIVRGDTAEAESRIDIHPDADSVVGADGEQVRAALGHLVRNALEAAGPDGRVTLGSTIHDDRIEIHIDDGGSGPDESAIEHLFDPFFSGRSAGRGRGLGLSIAWALAKNNGGDVRWAGREPGRTRFTLTLPKAIPLQDAPIRRVA